MSLKRFFQLPEGGFKNSIITRWASHIGDTTRQRCSFLRERTGLTFAPAQIQFSVFAGRRKIYDDKILWEQEVDDWLVENGVKANSPSNEAERLGFAFHSKFKPTISMYGDGYFNSALVMHLKRSDVSGHPNLDQIFQELTGRDIPTVVMLEGCDFDIYRVISRSATRLATKLEYGLDVSIDILADSLAYYLDERFNVTNRILLGH